MSTTDPNFVRAKLVEAILQAFGARLALSVKEAATLLPLSASTIYDLQSQGRFPVAHGEGKRMVPLEALIDWVSRGGAPPRPTSPATLRTSRPRRAAAAGPVPAWALPKGPGRTEGDRAE